LNVAGIKLEYVFAGVESVVNEYSTLPSNETTFAISLPSSLHVLRSQSEHIEAQIYPSEYPIISLKPMQLDYGGLQATKEIRASTW